MDCFEATCNFMHFNNERIGTYHEPSKLFKIYPVLSYLNKKLQSLYLSWQNIAIDESLTQWRGRLSFRWYIPLRASKFEIKSYELCDSSSGTLYWHTTCKTHTLSENRNWNRERFRDSSFLHSTDATVWCTQPFFRKQKNRRVVEKEDEQRQMKGTMETLTAKKLKE
ncbi:hypothetical protein Cfor_07824 [Coptotermes formosanus]|uniref:PiggyBac transposable element-derived protein domain-containing protein n=1 Tax=Coptotermes formosanus TaxID=36987 RepID=A0A6L2PAL7_COPFO|nr:hypothetical protein Cfor_07824 [Coptotermes formosanus]